MRKTVLVPVERTLCDAHIARDGSEVEAVETLTLGQRAWDLCMEHGVIFGRYLIDALGVGVAHDDIPSEQIPPVVAEHGQVSAPEQPAEPEIARSVMLTGEVPGYDWDAAREAVRNLGYEIVGRADKSTVLLILGEGGDRNATKLRDAREHGIPCMDVREPGRFKEAVRAGELKGGDPLPEPAKQDSPRAVSDRERNKMIREWARSNGYKVPERGRIPMAVSHAYRCAQEQGASDAKESHSAA